MKILGTLLLNLLLFVVACILAVVLLPIGFVFSVLEIVFRIITFKVRFSSSVKKAAKLFFMLAHLIDVVGGIVCAPLFNVALIRDCGDKKAYKYGLIIKTERGIEIETISRVTGVNYKQGTLTDLGMLLNNILNFIDPGHTIDAIIAND